MKSLPAESDIQFNDLHTGSRRIFTAKEFIAIDGPNPHEVDDAVYLEPLKNDEYRLHVAVADGSQIRPESAVFEAAVTNKCNEYVGSLVRHRILPYQYVKQMELTENDPKRALVIIQDFNMFGLPLNEPQVTAAQLETLTLTHEEFVRTYITHQKQAGNHPLVQLFRNTMNGHGLPYETPRALGGRLRNAAYGARLVAHYMTLANTAVAHWATANKVPILYRGYGVPEVDKQGRVIAMPEATDSVTPLAHHDSISGRLMNAGLYTRVTSPLRRASDLINHIQIGHYIAGKRPPFSEQDLEGFITRLQTPHEE